MRQRFSAEQWTRWFDEFDASNLNVREFCDYVGLAGIQAFFGKLAMLTGSAFKIDPIWDTRSFAMVGK